LYINNFIQYYILLFPVSRLFPFTQIYPNLHKNVGAFVGAWHNASKKAPTKLLRLLLFAVCGKIKKNQCLNPP